VLILKMLWSYFKTSVCNSLKL